MGLHMNRISTLASALIFAVVSGGATPDISSVMDDVISLAGRPPADYTADFRANFAKAVQRLCRGALDALPTNTPAEDAWVASEGKSKDAAKFVRLLKSKEYNRSVLKTTFSDCAEAATTLVEINRTLRGTETFSRFEAGQFIKLAQLFDVSIESYSSNIEMSKEMKGSFDDLHLTFIRRGMLRAAREALQDVR